MTDKIKLKADKFVNDKKLKLNYIKPKDLKLLLAEFCEEQIEELKAECDLAIEGRDVQIQELERKLKIEKELSNRLGLAYREYEQLTKEQDEHIKELETRCNELFLQTCEQAELIEKMKCCSNCMWSDYDGKLGNPPCKYCDFNNKWEMWK